MSGSAPERNLDEVAGELAALRRQLELLAVEHQQLQERLASSEAARADLLQQTEHIVHLLGQARSELRRLRGDGQD